MENIKKFEDFSLVNEEESASTGITMIIASTTAKLGGPNYDGKGFVLMPAGKYAAGQVNKVKFTIENTGSNSLFLSKFDFRDGNLKLGAGGQAYIVGFTYKDKDNRTKVITKEEKTSILIPSKVKYEFEVSIKFPSKFDQGTVGISSIFDLIMDANTLKGTTPDSKANGKIVIAWGWNGEVSYF
jgi:hypothetical protein